MKLTIVFTDPSYKGPIAKSGHYFILISDPYQITMEEGNIIFSEPGTALDGKLEFEVLSQKRFIERWKNMLGTRHGRYLIISPNEASTQEISLILADVPHYLNGQPNDAAKCRKNLPCEESKEELRPTI